MQRLKKYDIEFEYMHFKRNLEKWYMENGICAGAKLDDSDVQELSNKLGIHFLTTVDYPNGKKYFRFKIIDEQLFFLTKIKHGL